MFLGLRLVVEGVGKCHFSEESGSGKSRTTRVYEGEEKYLNYVTYLMGSKDCEATEIDTGVHSFNFKCPLPEEIPYSVEGENGNIRYKVDVNLDIPW